MIVCCCSHECTAGTPTPASWARIRIYRAVVQVLALQWSRLDQKDYVAYGSQVFIATLLFVPSMLALPIILK